MIRAMICLLAGMELVGIVCAAVLWAIVAWTTIVAWTKEDHENEDQ